jgi:hypothetical protein
MHYRVKVLIENCETGVFREAERTVTLNAGAYADGHPRAGEPRAIDVTQQERLIRWAVSEATEETIGKRP